jgi:maltose O-acetyltransferase
MCHALILIGDSAIINDRATLLTASHDIDDKNFGQFSAPIRIGNYSWVCTGATILPGVSVGEGAVVAAFSVVTKDVPPYAVVAGNPARIVKWRKAQDFSYRPNLLRACYEAWLGH